MSSKQKSLSQPTEEKFPHAGHYKIGIVVSAYHEQITFALRDGCIDTLRKYGVAEKNIYVHLAPGAFELPLAAGWLYDKSKADAIICLGCVIKGDTDHDVYINNAVATGLMSLSLETNAPFIFGLLTPNTEQQAKDRAGGKHGNKGDECAMAALKMLALKDNLKKKK
jgi:6,7-dimethyl-8-ribityllumazine synthase